MVANKLLEITIAIFHNHPNCVSECQGHLSCPAQDRNDQFLLLALNSLGLADVHHFPYNL